MKAGLTALLLALALPAAGALASGGMAAIEPAEQPVLLTYSSVRPLFDGRRIVVTRSWRIVVSREGTGWIVRGTPAGNSVESPPSLEPLARLEASRDLRSVFPIRLTSDGRIAESAPGGPGGDDRTFARAVGLLGDAAAKQGRGSDAREFLDRIAPVIRGPVQAQWPEALFTCSGNTSLTHDFVLPGGETGTFRSETSCSAGAGALPRTVVRRLVTDIAGSSRDAEERWSFTRP